MVAMGCDYVGVEVAAEATDDDDDDVATRCPAVADPQMMRSLLMLSVRVRDRYDCDVSVCVARMRFVHPSMAARGGARN